MKNPVKNQIDENQAENTAPENSSTENDAGQVAPENSVEKSAPENGGQMTLEEMAEPVAKAYADFDPARHAVNADGSPRLKADGSYALKRGRKAGAVAAAPAPAPSESKPAPLSVKKARDAGLVNNKAAARATVKTVVGVLGGVIGPEWDFESPEEADGMVEAVTAYYDANGQVQMSPEAVLLFQVAGYALPRFQHPNTRGKFAVAWDWVLRVVFRK